LAGTLMTEKRYADALRWLDLALRNRPDEPILLLNRARCCEEMGDVAGALAGFRGAFAQFRNEPTGIQYVNFVFRHGSPDVCLAAVEEVLPVAGADYRCVFLASAAAVMSRAGRRDDARHLLGRVLGAREDRGAAEAIVLALAENYGTPELRELLAAAEPVSSGNGGPR
jgi:Flp pilus assembly protein TadD